MDKKKIELENDIDVKVVESSEENGLPYVDSAKDQDTVLAPTPSKAKRIHKKGKFRVVRASLVALAVFTVLCGIIYPVSVTIAAQTLFPYEADGSIIEVTLKDGSTRVYGSELIGQQYEDPTHLFGRVNLGAPSNLSPHSDEFVELVNKRIDERKAKLEAIGYTVEEGNIPDELLTSSGSGLDPHISVNAAYFQVPVIVHARAQKGETISEDEVKAIIDRYTEGRFLGILGEKRVNVLLVNLALDGVLN